MANATPTTAQISTIAGLGDEALALLREDIAPKEYVGLLIDGGHFEDAVRFLAHALPKREAVWWAWFCARRAAGAEPTPKIKAALDATEKWIAQPTDEHRRAAMRAGEAADFGTPAGCAGMAAFLSGGSMAPPDAPAVPPGEGLSAKAVSGAVILAAVAVEPEKAPERYRAFLDQGMDVANRIKLW